MMQVDISPVDLQDNEELLSEINMAWTHPKYSHKEVDNAGDILLRGPLFMKDDKHILEGYSDEIDNAIDIINNFRVAHFFPLTIIRNTLHNKAQAVDRQSIVAQRLKRLSSIYAKLERFEHMKLWDIQDIGGCRAIVHTVNDANQLVDMLKTSRIRHKLTHEDDYIQHPKDDGYRSRHLVYRYFSDRNQIFNHMKIEVQIRTSLQHAWATAVETVDTFTQQGLKSGKGYADWKRFFQLMGDEMAFHENTPLVPGTPADRQELLRELTGYANRLQVKARLEGFADALKFTGDVLPSKTGYILLSLDVTTDTLTIDSYAKNEFQLASNDLELREKEIREKIGMDAVLVSVDSISNLRRAYPNYFADTHSFIEELESALRP
ncbi:MAG: RelA/SpoT domain-containing protein [Chloroflexi bacterium]|nr:RelA/SpoT domain-containing protein [Chloroflexota bacterium]